MAGSIRRFVYDQEDLVSVYDSTGCWQATVTHGPGIDQPLAFVHDDSGDCTPADAVGFREQVRTLQTDGLGSVTSLVSETSGFFRALNLKERYTYDSFGTPPDEFTDWQHSACHVQCYTTCGIGRNPTFEGGR